MWYQQNHTAAQPCVVVNPKCAAVGTSSNHASFLKPLGMMSQKWTMVPSLFTHLTYRTSSLKHKRCHVPYKALTTGLSEQTSGYSGLAISFLQSRTTATSRSWTCQSQRSCHLFPPVSNYSYLQIMDLPVSKILPSLSSSLELQLPRQIMDLPVSKIFRC